MFEFFQLVFVKARLNLRSEAGRSYLSYGWWVLEPLLHMFVFYLVFGRLLQRGTEDFVVFLLVGLIPWLWFAKSIPNAAGSILNARGLILQVALPKIFFPLVIVLQDTVKQVIVFAVLICFLFLYGVELTITAWAMIPIAIVQLFFISSCAFFAAIITPFIPDFRFLIGTGIQLLMFGSGIFYSYEILKPEHQFYFFLNPMATLLTNYRNVLLDGLWPDWVALGWIMLISTLFLVILFIVVKRIDGIFPRLVSE